MTSKQSAAHPTVLADATADLACPPWCVSAHGTVAGEEDWVHLSEPVVLCEGVRARLCMSVDPATRTPDGPHVLIGSSECTPGDAAATGHLLIGLAELAERW